MYDTIGMRRLRVGPLVRMSGDARPGPSSEYYLIAKALM